MEWDPSFSHGKGELRVYGASELKIRTNLYHCVETLCVAKNVFSIIKMCRRRTSEIGPFSTSLSRNSFKQITWSRVLERTISFYFLTFFMLFTRKYYKWVFYFIFISFLFTFSTFMCFAFLRDWTKEDLGELTFPNETTTSVVVRNRLNILKKRRKFPCKSAALIVKIVRF